MPRKPCFQRSVTIKRANVSFASPIGIAVVEHAGRFLVGVRGEDSPLAGLAEFPGGKCWPEETPAECAVRECREETGLDIEPVQLLDQRIHSYDHVTVELFFWLCRLLNPEQAAEEHHGFRWVPRQDLKCLKFPAANEHVVALISEDS